MQEFWRGLLIYLGGILTSIARMICVSESAGKKTTEVRHYITSLSPENPSKILRIIRMHWLIESMHWSLDVSFKEDACRVRDKTTALNLS
jgi:predicted transposase YbfD/YdcC